MSDLASFSASVNNEVIMDFTRCHYLVTGVRMKSYRPFGTKIPIYFQKPIDAREPYS